MLFGKYKVLYDRLRKSIAPARMYHDQLHTLAFGTDASFYRLIPKLVVVAKDEQEIIAVLQGCSELGLPVTFRAAGTSLSGQAISDSVLLIAGADWRDYKITDEGDKIRLQPGITGAKANALLARWGKKIGPDPASINAAMIGGIVANNASGMCCGTAQNSYKTIDSIRVIFADGTVLDTSSEQSRDQFAQSHGELLDRIKTLSDGVKRNTVLADRIRAKYKMKNTTGYSLNALVDFDDPFKVIEHLMIGSEGTLGFIASVTYNTVVEHPFKASSLMIFPDIQKACQAVSILKSAPVDAVELIDRAGMRSVEEDSGVPSYLKSLSSGATAILVEVRSSSETELESKIDEVLGCLKSLESELPIQFTRNADECAVLWKIRKGLFPTIGAMRRTGTTVIIEDVAFPVPRLAEATLDLQTIFERWGYHEAVIFGHALEGNLHFVFTQDFSTQEEVNRYHQFMSDVADLVVNRYDGSLKAEHGTGRNMAPFVHKEWGDEAFEIMKQIKALFDPKYLLNPGVILNPSPTAHIENLKPLPAAHPKVDKCIECGFCEPSCVSAGLTLSPRQRIVVYREMSRLSQTGSEPHVAAALSKDYQYAGKETCATDGLCASACPVKIDTGKLIKLLRHEQIGTHTRTASWIAAHMGGVTASGRFVLSSVGVFQQLLGNKIMQTLSNGIRNLSGGVVPLWTPSMPLGASAIRSESNRQCLSDRKVVYFPSCINRTMGVTLAEKGEIQLTHKMVDLLHKAGYEVIYPERMNDLCCGMPFLSKGYTEVGMKKSDELKDALRKASENGRYPILCDMSPCLYTMRENMGDDLRLHEPVEFILDYVIPFLDIHPIDESVTVFAVCSTKKMGLEERLVELARLCSRNVHIAQSNCCGFAGDRGFTHPELNAHGLRYLKEQLPEHIQRGYSTSRTCEIGLTTHSGINYKSIVYLVDEVSVEKNTVQQVEN